MGSCGFLGDGTLGGCGNWLDDSMGVSCDAFRHIPGRGEGSGGGCWTWDPAWLEHGNTWVQYNQFNNLNN